VNLRQYLLIFRARYRLALGAALVVLALGLPTVQLLPKQYTASTSMVLDIRSADPLTALLMPNNMATQEDIIRSDRVALKVISALKLDQDPQLRAQWADAGAKGSFVTWLAERLQKSLVINPVRREGNTITIQFKPAIRASPPRQPTRSRRRMSMPRSSSGSSPPRNTRAGSASRARRCARSSRRRRRASPPSSRPRAF